MRRRDARFTTAGIHPRTLADGKPVISEDGVQVQARCDRCHSQRRMVCLRTAPSFSQMPRLHLRGGSSASAASGTSATSVPQHSQRMGAPISPYLTT